ncbi:MAG TPA: ABC transporter substrate-binding protein [Flavilitoribacter sp.]|nr:ABC transporter substrate-binding protein [Flavilitoribacter sp.]
MSHHKGKFFLFLLLIPFLYAACKQEKSDLPVVGFADAFEDSTIKQARDGFLAALKEGGFSEEDQTMQLVYRNAQGDIPTLTQIIKYFISEEVTLIAACPTLPTITALQNTRDIPVFMMVAPTPELMKIKDANGNDPPNLFGTGENLDYIDTSFAIIPKLVKPKGETLRVGLLYNQSEPQSVEAYLRINGLANRYGAKLVARPVNSTADVKLVAGALLNEGIDAFFANPDNIVFGSFETIINDCNEAGVPVFTSEAGLVARGAVAAFGADLYQWGHQAGEQAAKFLQTGSTDGLHWEMVNVRKRVYNPAAAQRFGMAIPDNYEPVQQ